MNHDVVITGAGFCGLSAGVSLAEEGIKPLIIEKSGIAGGLARSYPLEGLYFDMGVHLLYRHSDSILRQLIIEAMPGALERRVNSALNIRNGKISNIPELRNFLRYPVELKKAIFGSFLKQKRHSSNLENKLINQYSRWLYDEFFRGYIEKKLPGFHGTAIHDDWWGLGDVRDEFNKFSEEKEIRRIRTIDKIKAKSRWLKGFVFGHNNFVIFPERGTGQISDYLESSLKESGASIKYNTVISNFMIERGKLEGIELTTGETYPCRNIIWTGMLRDLTSILKIDWPEDLQYVSTAIVILVFKRANFKKRDYLFEYSADSDIIFQRFYFNDFGKVDEEKFGICAEISYNESKKLPDDSTVVARTIEGLEQLDAIQDEELLASTIIKIPDSHPVYALYYRKILTRLLSEISNIGGIYPVGRSGAFHNIGMKSAILFGWKIGKHCANTIKVCLESRGV